MRRARPALLLAGLASLGATVEQALPSTPDVGSAPAAGLVVDHALPSTPHVGSAPAAGLVVDHDSIAAFLSLTPAEIAAAAGLRVLFIDHSVGANISDGLDCTASPSISESPSRCRRFEHVTPELSADPSWFRFGREYDRSAWTYHAGAPSYWREWSSHVADLLGPDPEWDVVIPMPSYLVGPNGGWQPLDHLEAEYPDLVIVYATTSLPRGVGGGTEADLVMQRFNEDVRAHAHAEGKPLLDVADILSHDYVGSPCFDTRDGVPYCQAPGRCEDLPDDGVDIPAICQHYTSELSGGHLGSVSGGALRMAQSMWVMMAAIARGDIAPTSPAPDPSATATAPSATSDPSATATTPSATAETSTPSARVAIFLPQAKSP